MKCPKCGRDVEPCGEVDLDGVVMPVYQCDACLVPWDLGGERFEVALTFAVDADGNCLDHETLGPLELD